MSGVVGMLRLLAGENVCEAQVVPFAPTTLGTDVWQWEQVQTPSVRAAQASAFDAARGRIVVFGGHDAANGALTDTVTWDGATWTQLSLSVAPYARNYSAMAFDEARGRIVMFGGYSASGPLDDTWTWDGSSWTEAKPVQSPPARWSHTMTYDAARGQVVMFGGYSGVDPVSKAPVATNDTWSWDGTTWTNGTDTTGASTPPPRASATLAFDVDAQRIVMFGGVSATMLFNDTWSWDGTKWSQEAPLVSPPARFGGTMDYDRVHRQVVLFGGQIGNHDAQDTWVWDGTSWSQPSSPSAPPVGRRFASMAYDEARGVSVLFGGDEGWTAPAPRPSEIRGPGTDRCGVRSRRLRCRLRARGLRSRSTASRKTSSCSEASPP